MIKNKKWFSIIEIMVWMLLFTMWIASVYVLITSTINMNIYNKNYIIASNLAREQIELVRNIRDTNYAKFQKWDLLNPDLPTNQSFNPDIDYTKSENIFNSWSYYRISNNFSPTSNKVEINKIDDFWEWISELWSKMEKYEVCLDSLNHYIYCEDSSWNPISWATKTWFYKYLRFEELKDWDWNVVKNSFKIRSRVIWYNKWYHNTDIDTVLTDWKIF